MCERELTEEEEEEEAIFNQFFCTAERGQSGEDWHEMMRGRLFDGCAELGPLEYGYI